MNGVWKAVKLSPKLKNICICILRVLSAECLHVKHDLEGDGADTDDKTRRFIENWCEQAAQRKLGQN